MAFQFPEFIYLYLVSCLVAIGLAVLCWPRVSNRMGRLWLGALAGMTIWTLGEFIGNLGATLAWQLASQRLVYLGALISVVCWFLFALAYTGHEHWLNRRNLLLLLLVPACSLFMAFTLEWHDLLYSDATLVQHADHVIMDVEYGLGYWLMTLTATYPYTLGGSLLLLGFSLRRPGLYRVQAALIAISALLPLISDMLFVSGVRFAGGFDPTSIVFVLSGVLLTIATQRYRFLTLTPVARDRVFETISVAVVVCDNQYRISDANPAFCRLVDADLPALLGHPLQQVLSRHCERHSFDDSHELWQGRMTRREDKRLFDVRSEVIGGNQQERLGYLVLFTDVTDIQKALDTIDTLKHSRSWHPDTEPHDPIPSP